ncbi:WD domain, G-beta repeat protein [Dictyocaulus viviparus]|uniref:WD domain, G-beta repeat protein n=1 Tax=Dictyocaulus viviparus TaxID=29172 RepID=A0A0D8Y260_DICVI|nr:WD domain, G-beta repeat protein [Dictyocaulus viviparus]
MVQNKAVERRKMLQLTLAGNRKKFTTVSRSVLMIYPNTVADSTSLRITPTYQLNNFPSGNRLLSFSSASSQSSSIGGVGLCESTSLSALWCARISAAVCASEGKSSLRFDHLSLCSFNGHSSSVRKIIALSNENSFISSSSDRTVKLWSIKPEFDTVDAQWTYNRHQRSIHDVALLANTQIASTDGTLHVWDPFHGSVITQIDWDGDTTICGLQHVDRHLLAAISSLHSSVRLMDTRTGSWSNELKLTNLPGLTRAFCVRESGHKMVVALSNGSFIVLDARTGRLMSLSYGNNTHTVVTAKLGIEIYMNVIQIAWNNYNNKVVDSNPNTTEDIQVELKENSSEAIDLLDNGAD